MRKADLSGSLCRQDRSAIIPARRRFEHSLPQADWLLVDRGYDADWLRKALQDRGIKSCTIGRKSRKKTVTYDNRRYKRCKRIEIMSGRLKDSRRVVTRYDRCRETYLSVIALATTVLFWL